MKMGCLPTIVCLLLKLPPNKFFSANFVPNTYSIILVGVCERMSMLENSVLTMDMNPLLAKLSCLIEVLFDSQCNFERLAEVLVKLVSKTVHICSVMSSNLVLVLIRSEKSIYMQLAEKLILGNEKHLITFKNWVCQEKH